MCLFICFENEVVKTAEPFNLQRGCIGCSSVKRKGRVARDSDRIIKLPP
jgi:hypothetical protein